MLKYTTCSTYNNGGVQLRALQKPNTKDYPCGWAPVMDFCNKLGCCSTKQLPDGVLPISSLLPDLSLRDGLLKPSGRPAANKADIMQ